jgi:hypothetical protein
MRAWIGLAGCIAALAFAACHHNSSGNNDLGVGDDQGVNSDGGNPDGMCLSGAATCASNAECCSNVCDPSTHLCGASVCQAAGASCMNAGDCCNLNCSGGVCAATQCVSDGQACSAGGSPCCSGPNACQNGTCAQLGTGCHTAGNTCAKDGDCCGGKCDMTTKLCAAPSTVSFCTQVGDVCYKDADCCTSICQIGATGAGTCQPIAGGTGCLVDGTTCTGCTSTNMTTISKCCSTYCGQYGTTGSNVCQPAGGCRIQGDLCHTDSDCCGGSTANMCPLPGDGEVKCTIFDKARGLGTCSMPAGGSCNAATGGGTCIPEGDVCHCQLVDSKGICWDSCPGGETCKPIPSGCSVSGVNANCCTNPGANKMTCRVDAVGVPRCFTVKACVMAGAACATATDCCSGNVCIPDGTGHFVCGTATCVPTGGTCTATRDCCSGSGNVCIIPPGQTAGVCGNPNPPPPPAPDGGMPADMAGGACSFLGQQCSTTQPCCASAGTCTNGVCTDIIL